MRVKLRGTRAARRERLCPKLCPQQLDRILFKITNCHLKAVFKVSKALFSELD